jgi:excisionase family DNA binding protein
MEISFFFKNLSEEHVSSRSIYVRAKIFGYPAVIKVAGIYPHVCMSSSKPKTDTLAEEEYLKVSEACDQFRVTPETIIRLLKTGQVDGFRVGNLWRISRASLEAYVDSTRTKGEGK